MTDTAREILERWQVRKTKAQKTAFIAWMQSRYPALRVETGGVLKSRNLILGDVERAKVVFTAHYDTCAVLPVPNFVTPKNIAVSLLYALALCVPLLLIMTAVCVGLLLWTGQLWLGQLGILAVCIAFFWALLGGRPNRHTANDNTSGVITLCEIYEALPPALRAQAAFVFFDLEEAGMFGSGAFYKKHRAAMQEKLLVNFDCVSDGDHLLVIRSKKARGWFDDAVRAAFVPAEGKSVVLARSATTLYPSDQMQFPCHVGVAAMHRRPLVGLYLGRIHTKRDTVFDERNIRWLTDAACRLTEALAQ